MSNKYTPVRPFKQLPDGTIEIQLTKGKSTIVDAIDVDLATVNWYAHLAPNSANHIYYAWRRNKPKEKQLYPFQQMHRVILSRIVGADVLFDKSLKVDHVNGNGLDNRRANLRICTNSQNLCNQAGRAKTSRYRGVSFDKTRNKYRAQITHNGKLKFLGRFSTPEEAYEAYSIAAREYYGEFANLRYGK